MRGKVAMLGWFKKEIKKPLKKANSAMPISAQGWGEAACGSCLTGRVYSFNWEFANAQQSASDWPSPDVSKFQHESDLRAGGLYRCLICGSHWYLDPAHYMMNSVEDGRLPMVLRWSESDLRLTQDIETTLSQIGQTSADVYGNGSQYKSFPCSVRTHSGEFIPIAIVSKQTHAPFEHHRSYRLSSDIACVQPSEFALPLNVRVATSQAHEVGMGFAPTILQTADHLRLTANWTTNFVSIPGVDARKIVIAKNQRYFDDTPAVIDEPRPVYFVADI